MTTLIPQLVYDTVDIVDGERQAHAILAECMANLFRHPHSLSHALSPVETQTRVARDQFLVDVMVIHNDLEAHEVAAEVRGAVDIVDSQSKVGEPQQVAFLSS